MNVVDYLKRATEYLDRHEIPSARLNAELLLAGMLGVPRIDLYTGFDRQLTQDEADAYRACLLRRAKGCPVQYITGEAGFRGLVVKVVPGVFIPRPETEVLVEKALEAVAATGSPRVLDVGTGTGCIAVSIASERSDATVTATDLDAAAASLCEENARLAGVADRVSVLVGDLFEPLEGRAPFDLIVSNPPYVPEGARASLPSEVRDFEPGAALFAGPEGLDVLERLVAGAPAHLAEGSSLALEADESNAETVAVMLRSAGWRDVEVCADLAGRPRVVLARRGS